jgi:iron(II)-dependent oxidoreductase
MKRELMWLRKWWLHLAAATGLLGVIGGAWWGSHWLSFAGSVVGLCCGGFLLGRLRPAGDRGRRASNFRDQVDAAVVAPADPTDTVELVETMLGDGRCALLMRPQILPNLSNSQRRRAEQALQTDMAHVPGGEVLLGVAGADLDQGPDDQDEEPVSGQLVQVDEYFIDRLPVTNRQFQVFMESGGYQQMAIWDPQIWPAVPGFVDQTGRPGPRFWKGGRHAPDKDDHPVVGITWYEAAAYARWAGKRLPTNAEWEKVASWPVSVGDAVPWQRRFPWGDRMERDCANLWLAGLKDTVPVGEFDGGANAAGVSQLVGNVWEWTLDDYDAQGVLLACPMKTIRGGAYDTYFESHATCQSASAESPLGRKHNIGFRCALSACDLRPPACADDDFSDAQPNSIIDEPESAEVLVP